MKKIDAVTAAQIIDFISNIENYVKDYDYERFEQDELVQDAVLRKLELIGEAMNRFSPEFTAAYPRIPFREAKDVRNKLIHEYDDVDLAIVWNTVNKDLTILKEALNSAI